MPCTASPNSFHTASGANPCGDAARAPHGERIRRRRGAGKSKGHPRAPTAPGAGCQCSILAGGRSCCREPEQRAAPGMLSSTRTTLWVQPGTGTGLRGEGHAGAPPIRQPRGAPQKAVLKHAAVSPPLCLLSPAWWPHRRGSAGSRGSSAPAWGWSWSGACPRPACRLPGKRDTEPAINIQTCKASPAERKREQQQLSLHGEGGLDASRLRPPTHAVASWLSGG